MQLLEDSANLGGTIVQIQTLVEAVHGGGKANKGTDRAFCKGDAGKIKNDLVQVFRNQRMHGGREIRCAGQAYLPGKNAVGGMTLHTVRGQRPTGEPLRIAGCAEFDTQRIGEAFRQPEGRSGAVLHGYALLYMVQPFSFVSMSAGPERRQ